MAQLTAFIRQAIAVIMAAIAAIGGLFTGTPSVAEGDISLVNEYSYALDDGIAFGQGITTDGTYFYGFGALKVAAYCGITKIDAKTGEIVKAVNYCIPKDLMLKGYSHLGDGSYYNGKLYIACEDFGFRNPAILVYDAETLDFVEYHVVPKGVLSDEHIPWCVVNNGIVYISEFDNVSEIKMLKFDDFSYLGSLKIDKTLNKIQGGDIYNGVLYLSSDDGDKLKPTYAVDLMTGHVEVSFVRGTGKVNTEAEGLAVYPFENGSLFHITDVGTSVTIRSYAPTK